MQRGSRGGTASRWASMKFPGATKDANQAQQHALLSSECATWENASRVPPFRVVQLSDSGRSLVKLHYQRSPPSETMEDR